MTHDIRRVAIAGAGIGGLMSALALSRHGIEVEVFERDGAPPPGLAPAQSMAWRRKGVPQSLHPHFFMGRLRALLAVRHPALLERLAAAGVGENRLHDYVDPRLAKRLRPREADGRLRSFSARRTTFEMTVRDYVATLPAVTIRDDAKVAGLVTEAAGRQPLRVRGVRLETMGGVEEREADAVIDATGRFGRLAQQLAERGVAMRLDQRDSGIWYFTRHYRLNPGRAFPRKCGLPAAIFPDFMLGALPADNGTFTVTFQIYRQDRAIAKALRNPRHFQAMCQAVAAVAPWTDPANATPTGDVHGFGAMDSFWRRTVLDDEPQVLHFFCVGDSCVRSNPKYGRGCTWSAIAAHDLADLLASDLTPTQRIRRYEAALEAEFRDDWRTMRQLDRASEAAFDVATSRRRATLAERFSQAFERLLNAAIVTEPEVFREVWTGYHGFAEMKDWMRRPGVWPRLARAALEPRPAALRALLAGRPSRAEMQTVSSA